MIEETPEDRMEVSKAAEEELLNEIEIQEEIKISEVEPEVFYPPDEEKSDPVPEKVEAETRPASPPRPPTPAKLEMPPPQSTKMKISKISFIPPRKLSMVEPKQIQELKTKI